MARFKEVEETSGTAEMTEVICLVTEERITVPQEAVAGNSGEVSVMASLIATWIAVVNLNMSLILKHCVWVDLQIKRREK